MSNLFNLNYLGPLYSTTKKGNWKGIRFVASKHLEVFWNAVEIYREANEVYGIEGPMLVTVGEDETKVKGYVA